MFVSISHDPVYTLYLSPKLAIFLWKDSLFFWKKSARAFWMESRAVLHLWHLKLRSPQMSWFPHLLIQLNKTKQLSHFWKNRLLIFVEWCVLWLSPSHLLKMCFKNFQDKTALMYLVCYRARVHVCRILWDFCFFFLLCKQCTEINLPHEYMEWFGKKLR